MYYIDNMKSETHKTTIEALAYGGDSVAHIDSRVVFIPDGVPGDEAIVDIIKDKGSFLRGNISELVTPSPDRVKPFCPFAVDCGGCQWQSVSYDAQLTWKRTIVGETIKRIGGFDSLTVDECLASPDDRGYRSVARYPALMTKNGIIFGYFGRRTHRIVDIDTCPVAAASVNSIAASVRKELNSEILAKLGIHEITIRSSHNQPSSQLSLTLRDIKKLPKSALPLLEKVDGPTGISAWTTASDSVSKRLLSHGDRYRTETINGVNFRIDESSFFQINIPQTERLVSVVGDMINFQPGMKLVDGYGGVGLFSLCCSPKDSEVILFDTSGKAVKDSLFNARSAGFSRFSALKAGTVSAFEEIGAADAVILDPPRTGLGSEAVQAACSCSAETIVYVSCNPATLARDLTMFCDNGYRIGRIVPVDMFPHTYHIETVVKLIKN